VVANELANHFGRRLALGCTVSIAKRTFRSESFRVEACPFFRLGLEAVAIVALGTHRFSSKGGGEMGADDAVLGKSEVLSIDDLVGATQVSFSYIIFFFF
jgi:hypothetical protein